MERADTGVARTDHQPGAVRAHVAPALQRTPVFPARHRSGRNWELIVPIRVPRFDWASNLSISTDNYSTFSDYQRFRRTGDGVGPPDRGNRRSRLGGQG